MTRARIASAARRCVSRREESGVTRRYAGFRRGMRSWSRAPKRSKALPAAVFALPAAAVTAMPAAWTLSASGIGERSGAPASGSAGRTGTSVLARLVDETSVASNAIAPSLPEPSAATKRSCRCSIAGCGWSVSIASLSSSGPSFDTTFGETSTSESPTEISPRQTSGSISEDVRQRRETSLADQVRLGWPDGRNVHLAAADDRDADPDRPVAVRRLEAEPVRLVGQPLVGGRDGLLETDADPRRLVVVVLVADRLCGQPGRLERVARGDPGRDEQVEVTLRSSDGAHARLHDDDRVRRVG